MTGLMIHDVTNPPLAARFFAYSCLAGYEVVSENSNRFKSMAGRINGYSKGAKPTDTVGYDCQLTALLAILKTAEKLEPSGYLLLPLEKRLIDSCRHLGYDQQTIEVSGAYAQKVSMQILAYAKKDKYNRISNYIRYTPVRTPGSWFPTPPAYFPPVEPYFNTIRPFTLDSASQFKPAPPAPFSLQKQSRFYRYLLLSASCDAAKLTPAQRQIAAFWDCNPFAVQDNGHMLIGLKKISPGAHWMGIAGIACYMTKTSFEKTLEVHTLVAMGLMDSFICCWDEKYRSNRIRPETAIRNNLDPAWKPLLQTPPFPEYLSGHSCVSATAATILTSYFGSHFKYTDNVEQPYGLTPQKFSSFVQAAHQAAISRFYGGIHFKDAVDNGFIQGTQVGDQLLKRLAPAAGRRILPR